MLRVKSMFRRTMSEALDVSFFLCCTGELCDVTLYNIKHFKIHVLSTGRLWKSLASQLQQEDKTHDADCW